MTHPKTVETTLDPPLDSKKEDPTAVASSNKASEADFEPPRPRVVAVSPRHSSSLPPEKPPVHSIADAQRRAHSPNKGFSNDRTSGGWPTKIHSPGSFYPTQDYYGGYHPYPSGNNDPSRWYPPQEPEVPYRHYRGGHAIPPPKERPPPPLPFATEARRIEEDTPTRSNRTNEAFAADNDYGPPTGFLEDAYYPPPPPPPQGPYHPYEEVSMYGDHNYYETRPNSRPMMDLRGTAQLPPQHGSYYLGSSSHMDSKPHKDSTFQPTKTYKHITMPPKTSKSSTTDYIWHVTNRDILCGRGVQNTNEHVGNLSFRDLVRQHQVEYLASKRVDKPAIAIRIMEAIQDQGGRFLRRVKVASEYSRERYAWIEIEQQRVYEKVCQALRDGAPKIREHMMKLQKEEEQEKENSTNRREMAPVGSNKRPRRFSFRRNFEN